MYEIIIFICQEEYSKRSQIVYKNLGFKTLNEACEYLGKNYSTMLDEYPIDGEITIKYNYNKHEPTNKW
jgi:hypothetical protein